MPSAPGAHFSSSEQKLRTAAEHGAIGYISIWAGKTEQRTPFSEYVRFTRGPALRWLDEKGVPNDAEPSIRGVARISSSTAAVLFEGAPKSWKDALQEAENSQAQAFPLAGQCFPPHRQPLLGSGESERRCHSAGLRSPA